MTQNDPNRDSLVEITYTQLKKAAVSECNDDVIGERERIRFRQA